MGKVISTNISLRKGTPKTPVNKITLLKDLGVEKDAHSGTEREVSLLPIEVKDAIRSAPYIKRWAIA